jgi:ankyrin repeat protein
VRELLAAFFLIASLTQQVPDTRIADAAMARDRSSVFDLLKGGTDVNAAQGDGATALHWAARDGDLELVQALLKAGADVHAKTRIASESPLFLAAENGHTAVMQALLNAGAKVEEVNANGTTILMKAAASGIGDGVKLLLEGGANPNAKESTNGQTALMFAAANNNAAAIALLAARGADSSVRTRAFRLKSVLVDENGDPLPPGAAATQGRGLGAPFMGGLSALHFAAREGHMEAIRALIVAGADINLLSADNTPPITEALINGHVDAARYLLDRGANPNLANADGLTPLYAAIDMKWRSNTWYPQPEIANENTGYVEFMKALLERGANVNARLGRRLWFRTFRYGQDWADPAGATAFWRAAQANDLEGMKFLVAHGANPKIATVHGVTALMVAAGLGFEYQNTNVVPDSRLPAVKYLVQDLKLDVNAKDDKDYTALHGAAYVGDDEVIRFLVSKGANVKARASGRLGGVLGAEDVPAGTGDTVADMANGPREKSLLHPDSVRLLESLGSENSHNCRSTACVNKTRPDKPPGQ